MLATTPDTTPVDMLVPDSRSGEFGELGSPRRPASVSGTRLSGSVSYSFELWGTAATSRWPGASTSGFAYPSNQLGPRELYGATVSSACVAVLFRFTVPTVMADGALPGDEMPPKPTRPVVGLMPLLPADTTTTIPARTADSTASTSGSLAAGS